jgi:hypothetical protein
VVDLGGPPQDRPAPAPHGLRDSFGAWVYETVGVKQSQERLGHGDLATTLRRHVRLTMAARAEAVAGLDEVTRAALAQAEETAREDAQPVCDNVVALVSREQQLRSPAACGRAPLPCSVRW